MTTFVSLYQAGEGIYQQFDKVLVIDEGHCVYFGPAKTARQYFIEMGFADAPRQTTADYLTGCTDKNERRYANGRSEKDVPSTAEDMAKYYREHKVAKEVQRDIDDWERTVKESNPHQTFEEAVLQAKGKGSRKNSKYQVSFTEQVLAIAERTILLKLVFFTEHPVKRAVLIVLLDGKINSVFILHTLRPSQ